MKNRSHLDAPPVRLRERLREQTQRTILAAAEDVFALHGLHAVRMESIAARSGVAVGTLYNYFRDRDDLLRALQRARKTELFEALDRALGEAADLPFPERLRRFLTALFQHFIAHRAFLAVLVQQEHAWCHGSASMPPEPSETMREMFGRFELLVHGGAEEGAVRTADPDLLPAFLLGMVRATLVRQCLYGAADGTERSAGEMAQLLGDFFIRGARP